MNGHLKDVAEATVEGIERSLGSGLVRGIGPILAKKLVGRFGAEVLAVIENRAAELVESGQEQNVVFLAPLHELAAHQFRLGIVRAVLLTELVPLLQCCFDRHAFGHYVALGEVLQALLQGVDFGLRFRPATGL